MVAWIPNLSSRRFPAGYWRVSLGHLKETRRCKLLILRGVRVLRVLRVVHSGSTRGAIIKEGKAWLTYQDRISKTR